MSVENKAKNKYVITILILFAASIVLSFLREPILNYLVMCGKEVEQPFLTFYTPQFFMFLISNILVALYLIFRNKKALSWLFAIAVGVNVISQIYTMFSTIELITAYNSYNAGLEWVKPVMSQMYISLLINIVYALIYVFLLIDVIAKHKFLKITKCIVLAFLILNAISTIMNFTDSNALYAITLGYGLLSSLAMAIYYWCIAENNTTLKLEEELQKLKTDFNNGVITTEEYAIKKEAVLKRL